MKRPKLKLIEGGAAKPEPRFEAVPDENRSEFYAMAEQSSLMLMPAPTPSNLEGNVIAAVVLARRLEVGSNELLNLVRREILRYSAFKKPGPVKKR